MKLSKHSKKRMIERAGVNSHQLLFYKNALREGKSPGQIKDEKIRNFLLSKENWNSMVKLYKGYVFVHSRNSKQLYTMYKLPYKYESNK